MTGIPEGIAALTGITTIAKGLLSIRDSNALLETKNTLLSQVYEVREVLSTLQQNMFDLQQANRDLQEENRQLQKRIDAADEYDLIPIVGGVFVLATKPANGERHHPPYYCQACNGDGKKSPLSFEESTFGNSHFPAHLHCQRSKAHTLNLPGGTLAQQLGYGPAE